MKVVFEKSTGLHDDEEASLVGTIHLKGAFDGTACGIAWEEYEMGYTTEPLTCITCITVLKWAKKVAKIKE